MTPQNRSGAPAGAAVQDSAAQPPASPNKALTRCQRPGCHRAHYRAGFCYAHYRTNPRRSGERPHPGLAVRPLRPKRVTDALHALAETPGLTPTEYERRKAEILKGATR